MEKPKLDLATPSGDTPHGGRRLSTWFPVAGLLICLLAFVSHLTSASTIPHEQTDAEFWSLVHTLSENGGYFRFQFMSNEREFPSIIPRLKKELAPGGIYFGVGPEQNFTYIAAIRPKMAFIFDIRRENMLEHLIYKAVFELATSRADFLSRLFSRKATSSLTDRSTVRELFQAFAKAHSDAQLFSQNLRAIRNQLTLTPNASADNRGGSRVRFPIDDKDLESIDSIYQTIFQAGPGDNYSEPFGGFRGGSSYAALMTATDDQGQAWSFLASEENFRAVRDLERRNMIVPLVGDFAGAKAVRSAGAYVKDHGAAVTLFYTSNVEQYLFQQGDDWRRFYSNLSNLPVNATSLLLRSSHYAFGPGARAQRLFGGMNYVMLTSPISELMRAFLAGRVQNYDDAIRLSQ